MAYGNNDTSLNATTTGTLGPIPFTKSIALQQDTMGFGDLIPQFAERWNAGVNNYMAYLTGDIPVGRYSSNNLANIGIGHGALDGGLGYTYFDPKAGHEFSAVAGLTGEHRRQQAPQSVPVLSVHGHEPVGHARSQDTALDGAFAIGRLIFDENLTDGRRIADDRNARERKSAERDRLFEMSPGPAFERVGSQRLQ